MKKTRLLPIAAISLMISLVGCNWQIPENVSVKTNAEYEFSAGEFNKSLDDVLDIKKMMGSNLPANVKVYDYFPGKKDPNTQRYLIKVALAEIPLDLDSMMAQIDFTESLKTMSFSQDIKIPSLDFNKSIPFDLNPNNLLGKGINALIFAYQGENTPDKKFLPPNLCTNISYNAGFIKIPIDPSIPGIVGQQVVFNGKSVLIESGVSEVSIPLDGMSIDQNTLPPKIGDQVIPFIFSEDTTLKSISGLTYDKPIEINLNEVNFNLTDSSVFESLIIETGSLGVDFQFPEGVEYSGTLNFTGGITLGGEINQSKKSIDLNGATIKPESIKLAPPTLALKFNNATIDFDKKCSLELGTTIEEIRSITANLPDINTSFSKSVDLPEEIKGTISELVLAPSGFILTYTNGLPDGNDLSIKTNSNFMGIKESVIKFDEPSDTIPVLCEDNHTIAIKSDKEAKNTVDFSVDVTLPGATLDNKNKVTLKNVGLGQTYKIGMTLEPKLEWRSVTIHTDVLNKFSVPDGKVNLGLNLNKMLKELGTKLANNSELFTGLEIGDLPVYIFCSKPNIPALSELAFSGNADLFVGTKKIGSMLDKSNTLTTVDALPNLKVDTTVTEDLSNMKTSTKTSINLGEIINNAIANDGDLNLEYSVDINGANGSKTITVKKDELKGTTKIALEAYLDLGLALTVPGKDGIPIDLTNIDGLKDLIKNPDGTPKDILQGQGKTIKEQGIDEYLKIIKEISIKSNISMLPFATENPISFNMTSNVGEWNLDFRQGNHLNISLSKNELDKLFSNENPNSELKISNMKINLPSGTFRIPRQKGIGAGLSVKVATDGSIKLMENGKPLMGQSANAGGAK